MLVDDEFAKVLQKEFLHAIEYGLRSKKLIAYAEMVEWREFPVEVRYTSNNTAWIMLCINHFQSIEYGIWCKQ